MFNRIAGAFVVLCVGAALAGSCLAETTGNSPGKGGDIAAGGARPHIFQTETSAQGVQGAVAKDTRGTQLSEASIRAASSEEIDGMEQTLENYRLAFDSLSLPQVRQVWPGLDRRRENAFKEVFEFLRNSSATPTLGLECAPPAVIGDSARVECRQTLAYVDKKGKSKEVKPARVSILLRKQSSSWVVDTMRGLGAAN